jgi:uncharacterized membrane protein
MSTFMIALVIAAVLGSAIVGGIFFAFSNFIMRALEEIQVTGGLRAMQSINVTVLNPGFLGLFTGTAVIFAVLAVMALLDWSAAHSPYLLGAAVAYIGGTWMVTGVGNVPLNHRLAELKPDAEGAGDVWQDYVKRWTRLNSQRAGAAMLAAFLLLITFWQ